MLALGVLLAIDVALLSIIGKMDLIAKTILPGILLLACSYLAWKHLKED